MTFPGTVVVSGQIYRQVGLNVEQELRRATLFEWFRPYARDLNRDRVLLAPWWIAPLYRWLPTFFGYHERDDDGGEAPYYLWCVGATRWRIGWLPARRDPRCTAPWAELVIGLGTREWRIPV